ncbi:MAG: CPBP family intramembrane glutamic endopeptidase [Candidatus Limnocylindrales bacterium]
MNDGDGVIREANLPRAIGSRLEARLTVAATALAVIAALIEPTRMPILAIVVVGFLVLRWRDSPVAYTWAAPIPILATFAWGITLSPLAESAPFACDSPLSTPAIARLVEAFGGVVLVLVVGRLIGAWPFDSSFRRPSRTVAAGSLLMIGFGAPLAVIGFRAFSAPFFGTFDFAFSMPGVLIPALVFALANGTLEEVVYRGAMLNWTSRVTGWWPAAIAQAIVFGAAHSGPGFVGSPAPVVVALGLAGFLAAVIVRRTGSLLPTIAIHVAVDVPLYLYIACRVP